MYYKEMLIDGVWHYKTRPNMEWKRMNEIQLTNKIEFLNKEIKALLKK